MQESMFKYNYINNLTTFLSKTNLDAKLKFEYLTKIK